MTMIERVTQPSMQRQSLALLQGHLSRLSELHTQLSTGKAFTKPSDDPAATVDSMRIRTDQRATAQHARNISDGVGWLDTVDSALSGSTALMRRARDLTVQAGNIDVMSPAAREAIAAELDATAEALRTQANATYLGRSVFAGTSDAVAAFDATGAWQGTTGSTVERRIDGASTVRVDSDGAAVFGDGPTSAFALLQQIATDLRAGNPVASQLNAIDARMGSMLREVAAVGARYNQLLTAQQDVQARTVTLQTRLTGVEDVDLAETVVQLKLQEVAYNASLGATERILQPSLMDFLR